MIGVKLPAFLTPSDNANMYNKVNLIKVYTQVFYEIISLSVNYL